MIIKIHTKCKETYLNGGDTTKVIFLLKEIKFDLWFVEENHFENAPWLISF